MEDIRTEDKRIPILLYLSEQQCRILFRHGHVPVMPEDAAVEYVKLRMTVKDEVT